MTAHTDIRAALESEIANVSGIPSAANRAWENMRFAPTTGTAWVRMTLIPAASRPAANGSDPQLLYEGLFQVDLFVPEADGPSAADTLADAVRDRYKVGVTLTKNTTNVRFRYSERETGSIDGPWYQVPVSISWYSYRS